jgi:hypothetical protein
MDPRVPRVLRVSHNTAEKRVRCQRVQVTRGTVAEQAQVCFGILEFSFLDFGFRISISIFIILVLSVGT